MSNINPVMVEFTPDDLIAAVMLIDMACEQGAFKGWSNIEKAFTVRERILKFAEQWKGIVPPDSDSTETGDTE